MQMYLPDFDVEDAFVDNNGSDFDEEYTIQLATLPKTLIKKQNNMRVMREKRQFSTPNSEFQQPKQITINWKSSKLL